MTGLAYLLIMMLLISAISEYANGQEVAEVAPVVAAQEAGGGIITGYLLGGWSKDGWLHDQEAARLLKGGETYRFYNLSGELGEALGKPPVSLGEPCSQTFGVTFDTAPACAGGIVGVAARLRQCPGSSSCWERIRRCIKRPQQPFYDRRGSDARR